MPGLDKLLMRELAALDPSARQLATLQAGDRNSMVIFDSTAPQNLLASRLSEDIFALSLRAESISRSRRGLDQIRDIAATAPEWNDALKLHSNVTGGRGKRRTSTFRVVARAHGERGYRRSEVGDAVAAGLHKRLGRRWVQVADNAQVEVWVTLVETNVVAGIRLTTRHQRHREKIAHIPASLRPSVAAALVFLSKPQPDDVFLDPFCGAGTILIERAVVERYKLLLGGDTSPTALAASAENIGERYKPVELHRWDAAELPIDDGSVSAIATNPPFGKQIGSATDNAILYPKFLAQAHRVLEPGGRLVVLTSEHKLMRRTFTGLNWALTETHSLKVLGQQATIYAAQRI